MKTGMMLKIQHGHNKKKINLTINIKHFLMSQSKIQLLIAD